MAIRNHVIAISICAGGLACLAPQALGDLPPVPVPQNNPITEPKRVLGKMLFWDEQLSSDNTMSCGTCHSPARGGVDPRRVRNGGFDGIINNADDAFGSPGVIKSDALKNFVRDAGFGLAPQVTDRSSMPYFMAAYSQDTFWDGRARARFTDPQTGLVALQNNAGLESQAVNPPLSDVEMAHGGRDWADVTAKLQRSRPMALATNLPADVSARLTNATKYPELFAAAFGDPSISASRIAMALATYQRTLLPNQSPWDRFVAGDNTALTPGQQQGLNFFQGSACNVCHTAPVFSNQTFRNIGVRPTAEDLGRQLVTGAPPDAGRFKVPSLRNVGLRNSFMHNGRFTDIPAIIAFYNQGPNSPQMFNGGPGGNRDQLVPVRVPGNVVNALVDFLTNGLTDPRVASETFPFDRPTLFTQRPEHRAVLLGTGVAGSGGVAPRIIAVDPAVLTNPDFRVGVDGGLGGAQAHVVISNSPPVNGRLTGDISQTFILSGAGAGNGVGTFHFPIGAGPAFQNRTFYFQWVIADPAAPGGQALSNVAQIATFCGATGCPTVCVADFNLDGFVDPDDLSSYIGDFFSTPAAGGTDINGDGFVDPDDLSDFIALFFAGC